MAALAALTKFAPVLLAPMLATHDRERRGLWCFATAFTAVSAALLLWPAVDPGLHLFYDRTIAYQADRDSPFSIWGQAGGLEPLRVAIGAGVAGMALLFAFRPRRRSTVQVAALGAALLIGAQLVAQHWFYLYIVWFFPLLLFALAALPVSREEPAP
jgi:hypothetical protein